MKRTLCILLALTVLALSFSGALAEEGEPAAFTLTEVTWDTATIAQCAVPVGYELMTTVNCCDETTCLGYPLRVLIGAYSDEEDVAMGYYCGEQYLQRVYASTSIMKHVDYQLDSTTMIFMLTYLNADQYCDARAGALQSGAKFYRNEDMSFYAGRAQQRYDEFYEEIAPGMSGAGMSLDWVEMTAAQKAYTFQLDGKDYCMCIMAEVRAFQYTISGYGYTETDILWDVPGYYMLVSPMDRYEELYSTLFQTFVENTVVNDQYKDLVDQLNYQIRDDVIRAMNMKVAASSAYMASMTALTFSMVDSQLSGPTYSSDRFSDYIFDQNDYTLSDGTSVKISTGYDYVYQGDNGVVYYSDSAFAAPGGATQLYPNH